MEPFVSDLPHIGWIDSASISQVVDYFDHQYDRKVKYPWSEQTVVALTVLLLHTNFQRIAPSPVETAAVPGPQSDLIDGLLQIGLVKPLEQSLRARNDAVASARAWAVSSEGARTLRSATFLLLHDKANFTHWISWVIESGALSTHVEAHATLIDDVSADVVGLALLKTPHELNDLRVKARDKSYVAHLKRDATSTEAVDLIGGYVCSALFRGRVHAELAHLHSMQLTAHPLRELILDSSGLEQHRAQPLLRVSNSTEFLARLIVNIASKQMTTSRRLQSWITNIDKARKAVNASPRRLSEELTLDAARDAAMGIARAADLDFTGTTMSASVECLLHILAGLTVHTVLPASLGAAVGPAAEFAAIGIAAAALHATHAGHKVANTLARFDQESLLKRGPGVVRRHWTIDGRIDRIQNDA